MAELLGSHLGVAAVAEVARVLVLVAAAQGERLDVIDHGSERGAACGITSLAKAVGSLETARPLSLACSSSKTFERFNRLHRTSDTRSALASWAALPLVQQQEQSMATSDGVVKAIIAGANIGSLSAEGRTSDALIKMATRLVNQGGNVRILDTHHLTSDGIIKIHQALGGRVTFEGA